MAAISARACVWVRLDTHRRIWQSLLRQSAARKQTYFTCRMCENDRASPRQQADIGSILIFRLNHVLKCKNHMNTFLNKQMIEQAYKIVHHKEMLQYIKM